MSQVVEQLVVELDGRTQKLEAALKTAEARIASVAGTANKAAGAGDQMATRYGNAARAMSMAAESASRAGKLTGEATKQLISQGSMMATMFGPTGAIVGAIGIGTVAIVNLFSRARDEARTTLDELETRLARVRGLTSAAAAASELNRLGGGDRGERRFLGTTVGSAEDAERIAVSEGIAGLDARLAKLRAELAAVQADAQRAHLRTVVEPIVNQITLLEKQATVQRQTFDATMQQVKDLAKVEAGRADVLRRQDEREKAAKDAKAKTDKAEEDHLRGILKASEELSAERAELIKITDAAIEKNRLLLDTDVQLLSNEQLAEAAQHAALLGDKTRVAAVHAEQLRRMVDGVTDELVSAGEAAGKLPPQLDAAAESGEAAAQRWNAAFQSAFHNIVTRGRAEFSDLFQFLGAAGVGGPAGAVAFSFLGVIAEGLMSGAQRTREALREWERLVKEFDEVVEGWRRERTRGVDPLGAGLEDINDFVAKEFADALERLWRTPELGPGHLEFLEQLTGTTEDMPLVQEWLDSGRFAGTIFEDALRHYMESLRAIREEAEARRTDLLVTLGLIDATHGAIDALRDLTDTLDDIGEKAKETIEGLVDLRLTGRKKELPEGRDWLIPQYFRGPWSGDPGVPSPTSDPLSQGRISAGGSGVSTNAARIITDITGNVLVDINRQIARNTKDTASLLRRMASVATSPNYVVPPSWSGGASFAGVQSGAQSFGGGAQVVIRAPITVNLSGPVADPVRTGTLVGQAAAQSFTREMSQAAAQEQIIARLSAGNISVQGS